MAGSTVTSLTWPVNGEVGRRGSSQARKGVRGAAGGVYVGPLFTHATAYENADTSARSITHATGTAAGGVEDTTSARESDTFDASGATGGFTGGPSNTVSRPTGRTAFIGTGVQGGSTPGKPFDTTGRALDTGTDRFGRSLTGVAYTSGGPGGSGRYTYTNFDGRSYERAADSRGGLGNNGRGTQADLETVTAQTPGAIPVIDGTAEASGTLALVAGDDKISGAIHADDVNGGANGRRGAIVFLYKRRTDTDEDQLSLVGARTIGTVAGDGADDTDLFTGLESAVTYVTYAAWLYDKTGHADAVAAGPFAARNTVLTT